jgi:hypothetical protein
MIRNGFRHVWSKFEKKPFLNIFWSVFLLRFAINPVFQSPIKFQKSSNFSRMRVEQWSFSKKRMFFHVFLRFPPFSMRYVKKYPSFSEKLLNFEQF